MVGDEIEFDIRVAFIDRLAEANAMVDGNVLKVTNMRYMVQETEDHEEEASNVDRQPVDDG